MQCLYWSAQAAFNGFVASLALVKGFSQSFTSVVLSVGAIVGILGLSFGSALSDILRSGRKLFIFSIASIIPMNSVIYFADSPVLFLSAYVLMTFLSAPAYSILDAWSLKSFHNDKTFYGHSRACGAAGYAVVILSSGRLISAVGYGPALVGSVALNLAVVGIALATKETESVEWQNGEEKKREKKNGGQNIGFLRFPVYIMLCGFMLTMGMGAAPYQNLKIILLTHVGGDVSTQGLDSFCSCLVQIAVFYFCDRILKKYDPKKLLLVCSCLALACAGVGIMAESSWQIIFGSCLIQTDYGLLMPAVRVITGDMIPEENRTFSNGILDACYGTVATTISLSYSGFLAEQYGVSVMLTVCVICIVMAMVIGVMLLKYRGGIERMNTVN